MLADRLKPRFDGLPNGLGTRMQGPARPICDAVCIRRWLKPAAPWSIAAITRDSLEVFASSFAGFEPVTE